MIWPQQRREENAGKIGPEFPKTASYMEIEQAPIASVISCSPPLIDHQVCLPRPHSITGTRPPPIPNCQLSVALAGLLIFLVFAGCGFLAATGKNRIVW
jgi:hypothetical protein